MAWCPRSSTVKKTRLESGAQVKLLTERSIASVGVASLPFERSRILRRQRSLSYPARAWERQARYLPSGEYRGELSAPGLAVILLALPPWMGMAKRSLLVPAAGTSSVFMEKHTSRLSGEM